MNVDWSRVFVSLGKEHGRSIKRFEFEVEGRCKVRHRGNVRGFGGVCGDLLGVKMSAYLHSVAANSA